MDIEKVKHYSLVELTLLAIFAIGLLMAHLIVKGRSRVILSEPLRLSGSGLSVSMPSNPGWERMPGWNYEKTDGCMFLVGQLRIPGRGEVEARWKYYFYTTPETPMDRLQQRAAQIGATIQDTGTIDHEYPMTYARMFSIAPPHEECFMGVVHLDFGRSVEMLVKSYGMEMFYAEGIFKALAVSLRYQFPQAIQDGDALMNAFLDGQSPPTSQMSDDVFLIKDVFKKNLGFYYALHTFYTDQNQSLRKLRIQQFELPGIRSISSLWFNPAEKYYQWKTEVFPVGRTKPDIFEIVLDKENTLTVFLDGAKTKAFSPAHLILPEPLLPEYVKVFLESKFDTVIVDVISSTGQVVPVALEKIAPDKAHVRAQEVVSVIGADYLHNPKSFDEFLFGQAMTLLGRFEQQPGRQGRIWEASSAAQLEELFQVDLSQPENETVFNDLPDNQMDIEHFKLRKTHG